MTFLDPESDALGAGWNITQAKIAIGSGGVAGKGFLQGTQSRLNFLPEKQTDFIFTSFGEEFGFVGAIALLILFAVVIGYGIQIAMSARSQFGRLLAMGITLNFFFYIMINGAMVMGLIPVVGIPMPLHLLWRHGDADGDVRLRPSDERACPPPGGNPAPFRRDHLATGTFAASTLSLHAAAGAAGSICTENVMLNRITRIVGVAAIVFGWRGLRRPRPTVTATITPRAPWSAPSAAARRQCRDARKPWRRCRRRGDRRTCGQRDLARCRLPS